jgi:hypothetical protein
VLTHMSPDLLARVDELGWETASDGMTLQLETAAPRAVSRATPGATLVDTPPVST